MAPAEDNSDYGIPGIQEYPDQIDVETFEQILEMDEDEEDRDFSKGIVYGFFEQAETTFHRLDKAFEAEDWDEMSSLGHFLKGSSATLGLIKVRDACEKIQHCKDELPEDKDEKYKVMDGIEKTLKEVKSDYAEVSNILRRFFGEDVKPDEKAEESPESD